MKYYAMNLADIQPGVAAYELDIQAWALGCRTVENNTAENNAAATPSHCMPILRYIGGFCARCTWWLVHIDHLCKLWLKARDVEKD